MSDAEEILVDNLKESLHQLQRYMVFGLGSSLFLLVLAITSRNRLSGDVRITLPSEFLPGPISLSLAVAIVLSAYWISGALATIVVSRANHIVGLLKDSLKRSSEDLQSSSELLEAVLTYPSIPTTKVHGPRIGLALLPAIFVVVAAFVSELRPNSYLKVFSLVMLVLPYIVIAVQLRTAIGGYGPDKFGD
jgi:hypothetical protein